jgi:flavin reductase (DIM6/NTAB) family NADH-FMN oxidoreductase RutF
MEGSVGEDVSKFRQALGQFATGVAIISAPGPDGEPVGMTVSSFNSVSLQPPLVLFSVARNAGSLPALCAAPGYAVNVLREDQQQLSSRFSRPRTDKWSNVRHAPGIVSAPVIDGALACFECAPYAEYDGGDHVIFVGRVVRFRSMPSGDPLLFFRGRYCGIRPEQSPQWPLPIHY